MAGGWTVLSNKVINFLMICVRDCTRTWGSRQKGAPEAACMVTDSFSSRRRATTASANLAMLIYKPTVR